MCRAPREITQQAENTHVKLVKVEETKIIKMTAQVEVPKITQQVENTHAKHVEEEGPEIIKMTAQEKVEVPMITLPGESQAAPSLNAGDGRG